VTRGNNSPNNQRKISFVIENQSRNREQPAFDATAGTHQGDSRHGLGKNATGAGELCGLLPVELANGPRSAALSGVLSNGGAYRLDGSCFEIALSSEAPAVGAVPTAVRSAMGSRLSLPPVGPDGIA
jgi:hypothetical protein